MTTKRKGKGRWPLPKGWNIPSACDRCLDMMESATAFRAGVEGARDRLVRAARTPCTCGLRPRATAGAG